MHKAKGNEHFTAPDKCHEIAELLLLEIDKARQQNCLEPNRLAQLSVMHAGGQGSTVHSMKAESVRHKNYLINRSYNYTFYIFQVLYRKCIIQKWL